MASATATLPRGRGPPMDFGRTWARDGRRLFGPSKTWSGFLCGVAIGFSCGLLQAYLILIAPPSLQLVPRFGPTLLGSVPVLLLLTVGGMLGDTLGSFIKRRLDRPSGSRALLLDQLPMVAVPILVGAVFVPSVFATTFFSAEAVLWLLVFTLGLHAGFNWIGYKVGLKKVPW
ncbi:MAG TPA: CDP-archaeol synthase [Thermoplasmata archaeon]|nr:CDP-archaeol synthase [Thermoplasmata archaeon]